MFACTAPPPPPPPKPRPHYALNMTVSRDFKRVDGDLAVRFTPDRSTDRLVFRLWPNGPRQRKEGQRLDVGDVKLDGKDARSRQTDPTTLVVSHEIPAHTTVTARVTWHLRVPRRSFDRISSFQGGLRLGSFFPLLAWDERRGWVTDPPTRVLAETSTSPTADFDVHVVAPRGTRALVSGTRIGPDRWHAQAVRDVAVAVAPFRITTRVVRLGHPVRIIVGTVRASPPARFILRQAIRSLRRYTRTYGPYRWQTFTLVAPPDLRDSGIEYPTLVYIGGGSIVPLVVHHETAHQWFYSLVGNDQATDPWLDEALATWAQSRMDGGLDGQAPPFPVHHVGAPMTYWNGKGDRYYAEVYGGGAEALLSLGDAQKVDCALENYVARRSFAIAQPRDLLAELSRFFPRAAQKLRRFGIHP